MLGAALYIALLSSSYINHVSPQFSYMGYIFAPAPLGYLIVAWLAAWLPSLWLPVQLSRPSQVVYWLLYVLVYVPSTFMPFFTLDRPILSLLALLSALFIAFAAVALIYRLPHASITRLRLSPRIFWGAVALLCIALSVILVSTFGLRFDLPGLLEVYEVRMDFREVSAGRLTDYSVNWLINVIFPLFIALGLIKRNIPLLILGVAGQLFIFSNTGFRSALFSSGFIVVLLIALYGSGRFFGMLVIWGATALVAVTWLLDLLMNTPIFSSMFVKRLIITPGILTCWYYDFFSDNPKAQLGHSILRGIVDYPYDRVPPLLIGRYYFGREETHANANLWADAFANFGFGGMAVFTLALMLILWLFDSLMHKRGFKQLTLAVLLLGMPAFTLSNAALITSLMTHGILLAWMILFFLPRGVFAQPTASAEPSMAKQGRRWST